MNTFFIVVQHLLPQHLLSRLVGHLAECRVVWLKNFLIRIFIAKYAVNMTEAIQEEPEHYDNFNHFFTRPLKAGLRPMPADENAVACPADGAISAIGSIENDSIFQAKGKSFSLTALLGGDAARAQAFRNGSFATVYLSPKDYHRVHMPVTGTLREMIYVPGKLYSVNQVTAENIDGLFAVNERAVCIFDTAVGPMAVVLVGAMIVAGIETVWAGHIAPTGKDAYAISYQADIAEILLQRGAELGRFKLGSTAIVLFAAGKNAWQQDLRSGSSVLLGQAMGKLNL